MKNIKACFSHNSDHWKTPSKLYDYFINSVGCLDPFPFMCEDDNFGKIYNSRLFLNPPFSRLKDIPKFVRNNLPTCKFIYLLIPSRTDTKYFHELLELKPKIFFIKGRLHFNDLGSAPFPTLLLQFSYFDILFNYDFGDLDYLCR